MCVHARVRACIRMWVCDTVRVFLVVIDHNTAKGRILAVWCNVDVRHASKLPVHRAVLHLFATPSCALVWYDSCSLALLNRPSAHYLTSALHMVTTHACSI